MTDPGRQAEQDVRYATELMELMGENGAPVEFWEAYCLATMQRVAARAEVWRLTEAHVARRTPGVVAKLLNDLELLRQQIGPLVLQLRILLGNLSKTFPPGDDVETALGFLAYSGADREAAARWLEDPVGRGPEAVARIRELVDLARQRRPGGKPADEPIVEFEELQLEPIPEERVPTTRRWSPEAAKKASLPPGVDPDILEDVFRVRETKRLVPEAEDWELFCAVMLDRSSTRYLFEAGDAAGLREKLQGWRDKYGDLVRGFRDYLTKAPIGSFAPDTMEMSIGFIIASSSGRRFVEEWLAEPERNLQLAADRFEGVVGKAMKYQLALREMGE